MRLLPRPGAAVRLLRQDGRGALRDVGVSVLPMALTVAVLMVAVTAALTRAAVTVLGG